MLEKLKNLDFQGGKDEIVYFLKEIVGKDSIMSRDANILCEHTPGKHYLSYKSISEYCSAFEWIIFNADTISLSSEVAQNINDFDTLNNYLVRDSVKHLFTNNIFTANMFSFNVQKSRYEFKNELFPLQLSAVRNVLVSQGLLSTERNSIGTRFYVSEIFENEISLYCIKNRKTFSLEELKKKIEKNEEAGLAAEIFVLEYEKKRLGKNLANKIKRISDIDVSAGYDIVSFESYSSTGYDRFIEVKAVSRNGFYWSKNEYDVAKFLGNHYYLYLVNLSEIGDESYTPDIINNPAIMLMENDLWLVEPQIYHLKKI